MNEKLYKFNSTMLLLMLATLIFIWMIALSDPRGAVILRVNDFNEGIPEILMFMILGLAAVAGILDGYGKKN